MAPDIQAEIISGRLRTKNVKLAIARQQLTTDQKNFKVYHIGTRSFIESNEFVNIFEMVENNQRSYYYELFGQGATIVPRQFWFIDIIPPPARIGMNPNKLNIRTSTRAQDLAKKGYTDVEVSGQVESQFAFQAVTGSELLPFGHLEYPLCVLPIEESSGKYRIIKSEEAFTRGYRGLKEWLTTVEGIWNSKRGEKAEKSDVYDWLNYSHKLTEQNPRTRFKVLYNASGKYLVACVIANVSDEVGRDGVRIRTQGVIADHKVYYWDTDNEDEVYYISAFLNAPIIDRLIKPLQSVGALGERDIHKKVLELPIPRYDEHNRIHLELSEIAKDCQTQVSTLATSLAQRYHSVGKIRQEIKRALSSQLTRVNSLALQALNATRTEPIQTRLADDSPPRTA